MTAPDSRDSVERVVAEMRCALGKGCTPQSAIREWADRLQALARGPQQAGGEVQRFRPTLQKSGQSPKGYIAVMTAKDDPRDSDWRVEESRAWVRYTDYAALQAEVARLRGMLNVAVEQARLHDEEQQAALREAGRDAERWRFLTSMDVGEYIGLVEYNNPDELAHAIDAARLVRDGDSGEG